MLPFRGPGSRGLINEPWKLHPDHHPTSRQCRSLGYNWFKAKFPELLKEPLHQILDNSIVGYFMHPSQRDGSPICHIGKRKHDARGSTPPSGWATSTVPSTTARSILNKASPEFHFVALHSICLIFTRRALHKSKHHSGTFLSTASITAIPSGTFQLNHPGLRNAPMQSARRHLGLFLKGRLQTTVTAQGVRFLLFHWFKK